MSSFFKKILGQNENKEENNKNTMEQKIKYHPTLLKEFFKSFEYKIYEIEREEIDQLLTIAQLSDLFRSIQKQPPAPEDMEILTDALGEEDWRRLALLCCALDDQTVKENLRLTLRTETTTDLTEKLINTLVTGKPLLPVELLGLSEVRKEEFARNILYQTNTPIKKEKPHQSLKKRKELDYERLLGDAQKAKDAAAEQLEELRKIQEEERMAYERSKW